VGFVSGHGFSRVLMSLRLTKGDENHGEYGGRQVFRAEVETALEKSRPKSCLIRSRYLNR
jgi:hypothetical protein